MLRIGLVAGEASGDLLGAGLIRAIRARRPDAVFEGVPGPRMMAEGCKALYGMERLSVMGVAEVAGRVRELHAMRAGLARHFGADPPAAFVGIDAPEFNLGLEARLKAAGVRTAHYVSPQVWAWRRRRIRRIARSADLMLTLFPFEAPLFEERGVAVSFVGHPLADAIPLESPAGPARAALGLPAAGAVIALLPGSRKSEVSRLAEPFLGAARWCLERRPGLQFVVPLVNGKVRAVFEQALAAFPGLPIRLVDGRSREVMAAADVVLLASGTATLEAMLLKRPMVVAYRLSPLSYWLARRLVYIEQYAMPNLLAGEPLVPEFIQGAATPQALGAAVLAYLDDPARVERLRRRFGELHALLRRDADERAAEAVLALAGAAPGRAVS
jgi:lipid-A-disaccharide synthase